MEDSGLTQTAAELLNNRHDHVPPTGLHPFAMPWDGSTPHSIYARQRSLAREI
jgi:hypothetical protein